MVSTISDRPAGRADDTVHDADPSAPRRRLRRHPTDQNGPALTGYGAVTMADALAKTITTLPQQLRQSVTWDRGKELSDHARFTVDTGARSTSRTRRAPGREARTKTRTVCGDHSTAAPILPQEQRPVPKWQKLKIWAATVPGCSPRTWRESDRSVGNAHEPPCCLLRSIRVLLSLPFQQESRRS